jgi:hypothetical protein
MTAMSASGYVLLPARGVLACGGADARSFLQGLVSNDLARASPARALWAALLTPQGKYLFDFMIVDTGAGFLLETEAGRLPQLLQRLAMYRLRAAVELTDASGDWLIAALPGPDAAGRLGLAAAEAGACRALNDGWLWVDPRLPALGLRALLPRAGGEALLQAQGLAASPAAAYDRLRLGLGVPEGAAELLVDKSTLLESGFDELHGVDFKKGCFVGQELTARMKYRGLVRKRLLPVRYEGAAPTPGTPVVAGGREIGEFRAGIEGVGLALLRLDRLAETGDAALAADGVALRVERPDWVRL